MISVDGKRESFSSDVESAKGVVRINIKKENLKKNQMNLIETNPQIIMTSDHPVSRTNSFKSLLNAKSFKVFLILQQLCEAC